MDRFQEVKKKKSKRNRRNNPDDYDESSLGYYLRLEKKLSSAIDLIISDRQLELMIESICWAENFLNDVDVRENSRNIRKIICYGLGSISNSLNSLYQYAMLLRLQKYFNCQLHLHDPIFCVTDQKLFENHDSHTNTVDPFGKECVSELTLFVLPHAPRDIFNNIIQSNWGMNLTNCIVLGDNLDSIILLTPTNTFLSKPELRYLYEVKDFPVIQSIENVFKYNDVFNDFAVHIFPSDKLVKLSPLCAM